MIKTWYNCVVRYMKVDDNGNESTASEHYLLDAVSYTDAEARIFEEMEQRVRGEFRVEKVTKTTINEVLYGSDDDDEALDDFYKVKVTGIEYDQEADKEKRYNNYILVNADGVVDAVNKIHKHMEASDLGMDFVIPNVGITQIVDVFELAENQTVQKATTKEREPVSIEERDGVTITKYSNF